MSLLQLSALIYAAVVAAFIGVLALLYWWSDSSSNLDDDDDYLYMVQPNVAQDLLAQGAKDEKPVRNPPVSLS